jgi:hypothetical protein
MKNSHNLNSAHQLLHHFSFRKDLLLPQNSWLRKRKKKGILFNNFWCIVFSSSCMTNARLRNVHTFYDLNFRGWSFYNRILKKYPNRAPFNMCSDKKNRFYIYWTYKSNINKKKCKNDVKTVTKFFYNKNMSRIGSRWWNSNWKKKDLMIGHLESNWIESNTHFPKHMIDVMLPSF